MRDLKGKTAIVTGAASGIGLGIAKALAHAGANIVLADLRPEPLEVARAAIATIGVKTSGRNDRRFGPGLRRGGG